jgi:hypothetical protein
MTVSGRILCHRMTVSGRTKANGFCQSAQIRDRITQRARSRFVKWGLLVPA